MSDSSVFLSVDVLGIKYDYTIGACNGVKSINNRQEPTCCVYRSRTCLNTNGFSIRTARSGQYWKWVFHCRFCASDSLALLCKKRLRFGFMKTDVSK